ncbi:hypothetical protein BC833DRAFT_306644 [Globomyces pollinis-pini]|nr:hypothetical protein BC833DRAFT_306644 [Globomyces pollinis-pini]
MKLTWLNISLLALSVAAADLSSLLEFDPPTLNLKDDALDNKFKCRLKKKLDKPVQVFFQGTGITFDKCSIEIGPNDFQNWKEINLSTVPVFEYRPAVDVTILARAFYDGGKVDHEYKGKRSLAPGGYCSSIGDPHYKVYSQWCFLIDRRLTQKL